MKECPKCYKKYDDDWAICINCNTALTVVAANQPDELSIDNLNQFFEKDFKTVFLPGDGFYDSWNSSSERLVAMAMEIFKWLKIDDQPIPIKYVKGPKVPGLFACQGNQSAIFVNEKHRNDPYQVGAILAHECMHYYMKIHRLESPDRKRNELKTDLSTISAGLGILIINGMSYRSHWYITIVLLCLGRLYINERRQSFGYYQPQDFCGHFAQFLKLKAIDGGNVIGFIHPEARSFLLKEIKNARALNKSRAIEIRERNHRTKITIQVIAVLVIVPTILTAMFQAEQQRSRAQSALKAEFSLKKQKIEELQHKLEKNVQPLKQLKNEMDQAEASGDTHLYEKALLDYESLLKEQQADYRSYKMLINEYNLRLNEIKAGQPPRLVRQASLPVAPPARPTPKFQPKSGHVFKTLDSKSQTRMIEIDEHPVIEIISTARLVYQKLINDKEGDAQESVGDLVYQMLLQRDKSAFRASIKIEVDIPTASGTQAKFSHSIDLVDLTADSMHELAKPENTKSETASGFTDDIMNQLKNDPGHSIKNFDIPAIQNGVKVMIERFVKATAGSYPESIEKLILLFPDTEKAFENKKRAEGTGLALNHTILTRPGKQKDSELNKDRDLKSYYDELEVQRK